MEANFASGGQCEITGNEENLPGGRNDAIFNKPICENNPNGSSISDFGVTS